MKKKAVTLRNRRKTGARKWAVGGKHGRETSVNLTLLNPFRVALTGFVERNLFMRIARGKIPFNSTLRAAGKAAMRRKTSELFKENLAEPERPRSNKGFSYLSVKFLSKLCLTLSRQLYRSMAQLSILSAFYKNTVSLRISI